jgi:hypothetical protein
MGMVMLVGAFLQLFTSNTQNMLGNVNFNIPLQFFQYVLGKLLTHPVITVFFKFFMEFIMRNSLRFLNLSY